MGSHDEYDDPGHEMGDNAKVWRTYVAESSAFDSNVVDEWNRTTDVILLFAALFSAVVTAFTIESYKLLSPDPQDITNSLLLNISLSLQASSSAPALTGPPSSPEDFSPSTTAICINALWFIALACSLGVGSLGMLVKQWLSSYLAGLPTAPHLRSQVRQHRYDLLRAWRTQTIINCMPLALSFSLIMFLAGLSILLLDLNKQIAAVFLVLVSITVVFHTASIILPAICNCPWKTAVSPLVFRLSLPLRAFLYIIAILILYLPRAILSCLSLIHLVFKLVSNSITRRRNLYSTLKWLVGIPLTLLGLPFLALWLLYDRAKTIFSSLVLPALINVCKPFKRYRLVWPPYLQRPTAACRRILIKRYSGIRTVLASPGITTKWKKLIRSNSETDHELDAVKGAATTLDATALLWLMRSSPNKPVVDSTIQSLAGLPAEPRIAEILYHGGAIDLLRDRLSSRPGGPIASESTELYIRALLRMRLMARYLDDPPKTEDTALGLLSGLTVAQDDYEYVTYTCAKGALNDMIDILEEHQSGECHRSWFCLYLVALTLGQDVAWRKAPNDDHWAIGQTGGWAQVSVRAVPILVNILRIDHDNDAQVQVADAMVAFALATFTQNGTVIDPKVYMDERRCQEDFYYLVVTGLSPILRFPASYGCEDYYDVVRNKYITTLRKYVTLRHLPNLPDHSGLMILLRSSLSSTAESSESLEALLTVVSQMDDSILAGLDCALLVQALHVSDPSPMFTLQLLVLLERLAWDCQQAAHLADCGLTRELQGVISGPTSPNRSQAFRLLSRTAYLMISGNVFAIRPMIDEGLLDLACDFFTRPGAINQEDFDLWPSILNWLSAQREYKGLVQESGILDALFKWLSTWRGRELMFPNEKYLERLGAANGRVVNFYPAVPWFPTPVSTHEKPHLVARAA